MDLKLELLDTVLIKNSPAFKATMDYEEQEAWKCFIQVVKNFLGNAKVENYEELVANMLMAYKNLGCNMSIKMYYLHSHISTDFRKFWHFKWQEQGERFHKDLQEIEARY